MTSGEKREAKQSCESPNAAIDRLPRRQNSRFAYRIFVTVAGLRIHIRDLSALHCFSDVVGRQSRLHYFVVTKSDVFVNRRTRLCVAISRAYELSDFFEQCSMTTSDIGRLVKYASI